MALALNPNLTATEFQLLSEEILKSRERVANKQLDSAGELDVMTKDLPRMERQAIALDFIVRTFPLVLM